MARTEKARKNSKISTFLGVGTRFKGVLEFEGNIRIDGEFEGEIITKDTLVVGESGDVRATMIKAGEVIVGGKVVGNIETEERIELLSSAKVYATLKTPRLVVADGVIFNGKCEMEQGLASDDISKIGVRLSTAVPDEGQESISSPQLEEKV